MIDHHERCRVVVRVDLWFPELLLSAASLVHRTGQGRGGYLGQC